MDNLEVLKVILFLLVGGIVLILKGFSRFEMKRQIEDVPTSPIATAAQGLVEFQGVASAIGDNATISIRKQPVACYHLELQVWVNGKNRRWVTRYSGLIVDRFLLSDKTGTSLVSLINSEFKVEPIITDLNELDESTKQALTTNMLPRLTKNWFFLGGSLDSGNWRVLERIVEVGQPVYVMGYFKTKAIEKPIKADLDNSGHFKEVVPRGRVTKRTPHPLIVSNTHQDGLLDKLNWGIPIMLAGAAVTSFGLWLIVLKLKLFH